MIFLPTRRSAVAHVPSVATMQRMSPAGSGSNICPAGTTGCGGVLRDEAREASVVIGNGSMGDGRRHAIARGCSQCGVLVVLPDCAWCGHAAYPAHGLHAHVHDGPSACTVCQPLYDDEGHPAEPGCAGYEPTQGVEE